MERAPVFGCDDVHAAGLEAACPRVCAPQKDAAATNTGEQSVSQGHIAFGERSIGGQARRAVHRLWSTCAVAFGSVGPVVLSC
jgi:hypothetical protein